MRNVESTELPLHRAVHVKSIAQPIVGRASEEGGGGSIRQHTHGYEKLFLQPKLE